MFDLYLHHGRHDPAQDMPDWGFTGPRLSGVSGTHWTYGTMQIVFADAESARAAQEVTGWGNGNDEHMLEMPLHDDLVLAVGKDEVRCYYGDWGLMLSCPSRWSLALPNEVEKARKAPAAQEVDASLKPMLIDQYGLAYETVGGGAQILSHTFGNDWSISVTCLDGGALPRMDSWHVGVYQPGNDGSATWEWRSDDIVPRLSLKQALGAGWVIGSDA